jgi:hypothetical protein
MRYLNYGRGGSLVFVQDFPKRHLQLQNDLFYLSSSTMCIFSPHSPNIRGLADDGAEKSYLSNPPQIGLLPPSSIFTRLTAVTLLSRPVAVRCANIFHTKSLFARSVSSLPVRRGSSTPHHPHPHPHPCKQFRKTILLTSSRLSCP